MVVVIIIYHIIRSARVDFNYDMEVLGEENCDWVGGDCATVFRDQDQYD